MTKIQAQQVLRRVVMTQLPEPSFIERDPDVITKEWITAYEEKKAVKYFSLHKLKE